MSSMRLSCNRKRNFSEFRDKSYSEKLHPSKRKKGELPLNLKTKLQQVTSWFLESNLNRFMRMALKCGGTLPMVRPRNELEDDSEDDDEEDIEDEIEEEDDDSDIQEIKEIGKQDKLSPLVQQFGKSHLSSDSGRLKQKLFMNGSYSLGSCPNTQVNGGRPLNTRYHGSTNCSIRREETEKLKRQPLISSPATEVEIFLGNEPEVVALEGGNKLLTERPVSKQNRITSTKAFCSSLIKSQSSKCPTSVHNQDPVKKSSSSSSKFYTANEVVRLQEKAQYKLLLDKYVKGTHPPICTQRPPDDPRRHPTSHFQKEVLKLPIDSFIEKYYHPCKLLPPKVGPQTPPESAIVDIDDEEEEEEDNDEVKIVAMKIPEYKAVFTSDHFTKEWLSELKEHVRAQTEERNKIVKDYERKLEQIKRERLLKELRVGIPESKPVKPVFPELTPAMEDIVDNILNTGAPEDPICKSVSNNDPLNRRDFDTLTGLKWLNDAIINSYFELIVERSKKEGYPSVYAFNTFFFSTLKNKGYPSVRRWTRKVDIFSYDINFVPLHTSCHWCLAVIDHRSRKISYYDSMGVAEECCLPILHEYLCNEYKDKKGEILDKSLYVTETVKEIPQQLNGSDCGVFTLKFAEYIARNAEINFSQQQMQYFRRRTVYELFAKEILL